MSRLVKNTIYNLIGQGALLVLGFVAVRYIFRGLGEDALGIIYFALAASSTLSAILDMGIGASAIREVSSHATSDPEYVAEFVRTGSLFFWSVYVLLALAIFLGAPLVVDHWIKLKTLDSETAIQALRVIGIAALVALPRTLYVGVLRGLQRMEFNNLIDVAASGLQQFGTIAILFLGGKLLRVVLWFAICYLLSIATYVVICSKLLSWRAMVPGFSSVVVKKNFNFASNMAATAVLSVIESQADKAIVSKLLPIGMFGYYGTAYAAVSKGMLIAGSIADAALPSFCQLHRIGSTKALLSQYNKLQDLLCFISVPIFAAIPFAALPVFTFVLNSEAAHLLLLPITFLCFGFYLNASLTAPYIFSLAVGRPDIASRFTFYALFVAPPTAIILIYFFCLKGAGFSWVAYNSFSYFYCIPRICAECGLGITAIQWYAHVLRFLGPATILYGLAWIVCRTAGHSSIASLVGGYLLASLVFVCGSFLLFGPDLRSTLQSIVRTLRAKYVEAF